MLSTAWNKGSQSGKAQSEDCYADFIRKGVVREDGHRNLSGKLQALRGESENLHPLTQAARSLVPDDGTKNTYRPSESYRILSRKLLQLRRGTQSAENLAWLATGAARGFRPRAWIRPAKCLNKSEFSN